MCLIFKLSFTICLLGTIAFAKNLGIMGGRNASIGEFPYQAYIRQEGVSDYWFLCGGVVISPSWVLSAARCVNTTASYQIIVGVTNMTDTEGNYLRNQTRKVGKFVIHPEYNEKTSINDISLMKVDSPLIFNDFIQPALLAGKSFDSKNGAGLFSGWGVIGGFNPYPTNLQVLEANILTFEECNSTLQKIINDTEYNVHSDAIKVIEDDTKICTGPLDDFKGACFGDEGSPLTKLGVVIGVNSFVIEPCGRENAPSIFSRVSAYLDWIKENVDEDIKVV